ncbi:hypothetical protein L2719_12095 [Shewanella schlegeliana]|uniref:Uncharacterized protein n=1 Tax=Shewanella schlegeliana TaxID=190308 RepID=A0ABS1ST92_9GAMM|nr:hypothetical protein [Shewanella schlegeliana]MBL4911759.1 hypothetical protein [Shewanella schlegeliana]MCL1110289.1 hypothetical protein [Shewanella schlegeliana]GIU31565.1 hypothetical protein TUM4433_23430 [Shewanella schlegeliana]
MRVFKAFWFWFGLVACPVIFIASVFNTGRLFGYLMFSEQAYTQGLSQALSGSNDGIELLITISLGICAFSEFMRSFYQLKVRFAIKRTSNLD